MNFDKYLVRRGLATAGTSSGSDCFLIQFIDENEQQRFAVAASSQLYNNREYLGLEFKDIYESRSCSNWAAKITKQPNSVNIFKINSYRVDIDGPVGLQFVETAYGDDNLQIYLPYNYGKNIIDEAFPAFILNKNLRRIVVAYPDIENTLKKLPKYFGAELEEKPYIKTVKITSNLSITIIDDRCDSDRSRWGSFEFPSKDLKMMIRLLLRAGWIDSERMHDSDDIYTMEDLNIEESSNNILGFEVVNGQIMRFTKYSDKLWISIPVAAGGLTFIKPKEKFVYHDDYENCDLVADSFVKINSIDRGVYFIGFNLEHNFVFQTKKYGILDIINGTIPKYEIDSIWPCDEPEPAEEPDEESAEEAE